MPNSCVLANLFGQLFKPRCSSRERRKGPSPAPSPAGSPCDACAVCPKDLGLLARGDLPSASSLYAFPPLLTYLSHSVFILFLRQ